MPYNTWEAPVYKGDDDPKACTVCHKQGKHIRLVVAGEVECSHVDCPLRKHYTAQPTDKPEDHK